MTRMCSVGLIQMHCSSNRGSNIQKAEQAIRGAAKKGAQIICLPELFATEYFCQTREDRFFAFAESIPGPLTHWLSQLAKELEVVLVTSIYERSAEGQYFNTAVVVDADGTLLGRYRKIHVPNDPENGYDETYYFADGNLGYQVFATRYAKIAPMICWDQWFPEGARLNAVQGAEILFYPTAIGWPIAPPRPELNRAEHEAWQIVQRGHAIANNVHVVAVNRVGLQDQTNFWGTSFVSDPYGRMIAQAATDQEETIIVQCDLEMTEQMRKDWPFIECRRIRYEQAACASAE